MLAEPVTVAPDGPLATTAAGAACTVAAPLTDSLPGAVISRAAGPLWTAAAPLMVAGEPTRTSATGEVRTMTETG